MVLFMDSTGTRFSALKGLAVADLEEVETEDGRFIEVTFPTLPSFDQGSRKTSGLTNRVIS